MDPQSRWAVEQMQRYLRDGNTGAVLEIATRLLPLLNDDPEARLLALQCMALAREQRGEWAQALEGLEQCRALDCQSPAVRSSIARVLLKMGRYAQAGNIFLDLTRLYPQCAEYHAAAGTALLHLRNPEAALHHLRRARELNPADPYILNDIAGTYLLLGDLESALSAYKQAIEQVSDGDRSLLRDIRDSIEEVKAALALRRHAAGRSGEARVEDIAGSALHEAPGRDTHPHDDPTRADPVRALLLKQMGELGCRPRQILAALHLWSDFVETLDGEKRLQVTRRIAERSVRPWVASIVYAIGRIERAAWGRQSDVAKTCGVGTRTVSQRYGELRRALKLQKDDPRYSTASGYQAPVRIATAG
ncbi:MAG: tetratricopeptide repeat protein [Candidatus Sumerlaeia bacterium]|nr:tetratricopeptide repeat protein [Candidatus Sumerlaeia bacterium]